MPDEARFDDHNNKSWLHNHALSAVLFGLFIASWVGQFVTQAIEMGNQARSHGDEFQWADFWPAFGQATFENWQSEFLQILAFVLLTVHLIHKGSHESRDGQDRMENKIDHLIKLIEEDKA